MLLKQPPPQGVFQEAIGKAERELLASALMADLDTLTAVLQYHILPGEILAADAFAYVQTQGGLNREIGMKYSKTIREVGNSVPPMEAYKAFRGQEPTTDALLKRRGLN